MATNITSIPNVVNYTLWQGDTWSPGTITCTQSSTPINLTGYAAKLQIRTVASDEVVQTLTSPSSGIVLGGAAGTIILSMTTTQTTALLAGDYKYDLQMTSPTAAVTTYLYGTITVSKQITT